MSLSWPPDIPVSEKLTTRAPPYGCFQGNSQKTVPCIDDLAVPALIARMALLALSEGCLGPSERVPGPSGRVSGPPLDGSQDPLDGSQDPPG